MTDDAAAINAALAGGNTHVYFPAGEYLVQSHLRLFENTLVEMHPDAVIKNDSSDGGYVFVNGDFGNTTYASGYDGDGNITIRGGRIDGDPRFTAGSGTTPIAIGHARNVLIEGVRFRNNYSSHFIEINSSQHVTIRKCIFDTLDPVASSNREHINVDYAFAVGFPPFGSYDDTPCDDVLIENNVFLGGQVGIGTHSSPSPGFHTDIKVLNNYFDDFSDRGVRALRWKNSRINGNRINGTASNSIVLQDCEDCFAQQNIITNSRTASSDGSSVFVNGGARCDVGPNIIKFGDNSDFNYAIDVQAGGVDHRIWTDGAEAGNTGVIEDDGTTTKIDDVFVFRLADDTAASVLVPAVNGSALAAFSTNLATGTANPKGFVWVNADSSPATNVLSFASETSLSFTTGVLNGTTGADGEFTISVHTDGRLYLENRSGSERVVTVQFLASLKIP